MSFSNTIKRSLLIRDDEWSLVTRLFTFEFFQGASIALLFTSALSLFLHYYHAADLPKVFMFAALLMWAAGLIYNRLEHRLNERQLTLAALLFNALSILLIRLVFYTSPSAWFYFLALAWFNVAYLLNNLEFWGLTSILFDVRQSKRLFGVVSAGDVPAKLIGYVAASSYIATAPDEILQTQNLLWIAFGFSAISFLLFWRLHLSGLLEIHIVPQGRNRRHLHQSLFQKIKNHRLIFNVAFVSLLTLCCYLITNFVLYGYVEQAVHDSASLTLFIALFMGASRGLTLVLKLIFTGRLLDRFGFRNSLLITPIVTLLACITLLIFSPVGVSVLLWFGVLAILLDALRSSIQSPVLLAAMQPLPVHDRMSGHTIMKGMTDPLAYLLIGSMLWILIASGSENNYVLFTSILILIIIAWLFIALRIEGNYLQTLAAAIRDRNISGEEIPFTDKETVNVLKEKLNSPDEWDVAFVLHLLHQQSFDEKTEMVKLALQHPSPAVRIEALSLLNELPRTDELSILAELLAGEQDEQVIASIIRCNESSLSEDKLRTFLENESPDLQQAAMIALCRRNRSQWSSHAQNMIKRYEHSANETERIAAIKIICEIKNDAWFSALVTLANDENRQVATEAIDALGRQQDEFCSEALCILLCEGKHLADVKRALIQAGDPAISPLSRIFYQQDDKIRNVIVSILGKMHSSEAIDQLKVWGEELPSLHDSIFQALADACYRATSDDAKLKKWIPHYLSEASIILLMISSTSDQPILSDALRYDLDSIRGKLLRLFSFFYAENVIAKVRAGFELNTRESISNALELIDNEVEKKDARLFNTIFEQAPVAHRCRALISHFAFHDLTRDEVVTGILTDELNISSWSKACFLFTNQPLNDEKLLPAIKKLASSGDEVLKETAWFTLNFSLRGNNLPVTQ